MNQESTYKVKFHADPSQANAWSQEELTLPQLKERAAERGISPETLVWDSINSKWIMIKDHPQLHPALFSAAAEPKLTLKKLSGAEAPTASAPIQVAQAVTKRFSSILSGKEQAGMPWPQLAAFISITGLLLLATITPILLHAGELGKVFEGLLNLDKWSLLQAPYLLVILLNMLGIGCLFGPPETAMPIMRMAGMTTGGYLAMLGWLSAFPSLLFCGAITALACWIHSIVDKTEEDWKRLIPTCINGFAMVVLSLFICSTLL